MEIIVHTLNKISVNIITTNKSNQSRRIKFKKEKNQNNHNIFINNIIKNKNVNLEMIANIKRLVHFYINK